jgi:hypothetical protein
VEIFLRILTLGTKTKKIVHLGTYLQQNKIHGLKPKIHEHTGTKRSIKPLQYYIIVDCIWMDQLPVIVRS